VQNSDYSFLVKTIVKTGKYVITVPWSTSSADYDNIQTNTSNSGVGTLSALTPVKTNLTNQASTASIGADNFTATALNGTNLTNQASNTTNSTSN